MKNNLIYSPNIQAAIQLAIKTHHTDDPQKRKGAVSASGMGQVWRGKTLSLKLGIAILLIPSY